MQPKGWTQNKKPARPADLAGLPRVWVSPKKFQPNLVDASVASGNDLAESHIRYVSDGRDVPWPAPLGVVPSIK